MLDSTLPPESLSGAPSEVGREVSALVLLWSRDEPARVGEVLLVPSSRAVEPWVFGRDDAGDRAESLRLVRQRPGREEATGPLSCPRISRAQLRVGEGPGGTLVVANVGQCPLLREGRQVSRVELHPGDVIELRNELIFLCARRPARLPPLPSKHPTPIQPFGAPDAHGLVGEGPAIWELRRTLGAVARRPEHVLVLGPSGSGKELVARILHACSPRRDRPLVSRNAATLPEGLVDAELFGNVKGFPNPGMPERPGLVGEADGGTLFLDEIGELPVALQAHLLRVLDEGEYQRLGDARARRADLRLVGATNRPAEALKEDVLARFKVRVTVPDLNARREDIPLLVLHLLRRQASLEPQGVDRFFPGGDLSAPPRVSPALVAALVQHLYRTHVRELDAALLRAALESQGKYVELTPGVRRDLGARAPAAPAMAGFTEEEARRLSLQRRHRFSATACGRDPAYGVNRQTADLHLRHLCCKALVLSGWDLDAAAALLAGEGGDEPRGRLRARIETTVENLRRRLADEDGEALRRALTRELRAGADAVLAVLDAIERGPLAAAPPPG